MKRFFLILAVLLLVGTAVVVGRFILATIDAFNFAQSQARVGRAYMDGMRDEDFKEVGDYACELMAEAPAQYSQLSLSKVWSDGPVPVRWQERGVTFIRYDRDSVCFGWHGGPFAHTQLDVRRGQDGALTFTAHYTDYTGDRLLRTVPKAQSVDR